jgi:hypothetical protein
MNREAQIATMLTVGFAAALFGWAIVYIASSPTRRPHEDQRPTASRFRRWLDATRHRLLESPRLTGWVNDLIKLLGHFFRSAPGVSN